MIWINICFNYEPYYTLISNQVHTTPVTYMANKQKLIQKASQMMQTYLGEDPDSSEALDFLCLAESGEVSHYEVLSAMTQGIKDSQFATKVQ